MNKNIKNIHRTKWARSIKKTLSSYEYEEALKIAGLVSDPKNTTALTIYKQNEILDKDMVWAIDYKGFWMNCFPTKEEAVKLCKKMGWRYEFFESGYQENGISQLRLIIPRSNAEVNKLLAEIDERIWKIATHLDKRIKNDKTVLSEDVKLKPISVTPRFNSFNGLESIHILLKK